MMKLYFKFTAAIIAGLIAFLMAMGLIMVFLFEGFFPAIGFPGAVDHMGIFLLVCCISFIVSSLFFSLSFVKPLLFVLSMLGRLTIGSYIDGEQIAKIHNRKGALRLSYRLYSEVISDLAVLSDTLQKAEKERDKLETAKRNWISGVSHDIKTPLSYITGYSTLLLSKEHQWNADECLKFMEEINQKSKYIEELIGDLNLTFRLESADTIPLQAMKIDICKFVQRIIADIANNPVADAYELELETPDNPLFIHGDEKLLARALQNLFMNAIEHNPQGTKISTLIQQNSADVTITVEDNGVGIAADILDILFTKYAREGSKDAGSSRGLGLSVVKSIVEAHKGSIHVESEDGEGSRFVVVLPCSGIYE